MKKVIFIAFLSVTLLAGCGINSVTKRQLENVKVGDRLIYRFQKDGKSWFYADKITRIENNKIYYNPGKMEATAGNDERLNAFQTDKEGLINKDELLEYETEQGDQKKLIIWIK